MPETSLNIGSTIALPKAEFDGLLAELRQNGYQTIGPRVKDESIIYEEVETLADFPRGYRSEQEPGRFHLVKTRTERYFDAIPGAQSWKRFLFPPHVTLLTAQKNERWHLEHHNEAAPRYALIGVRPCELAAIEIQDKVFLRSDFYDPIYRARRERVFILAVNCLYPAGTCFCTSLDTGPKATRQFDLLLTECDDAFLIEIGSELGKSMLAGRSFEPASAFILNTASQNIKLASEQIERRLETSDLPMLMTANLDAHRWDEVAKRCLSCANCTQVCPTCFCWDATDHTYLTGKTTRRERVWDSCFNPNYSYQAGGNTRPNIRSRYRQWLTHKFGTWQEQFGTIGCTGCGRCLTWCPAGIDHLEEIAALRAEVAK
ncbi:MAG: 4Fe-4S dicluster domain-containing protein [Chloroflexota bacterium]